MRVSVSARVDAGFDFFRPNARSETNLVGFVGGIRSSREIGPRNTGLGFALDRVSYADDNWRGERPRPGRTTAASYLPDARGVVPRAGACGVHVAFGRRLPRCRVLAAHAFRLDGP